MREKIFSLLESKGALGSSIEVDLRDWWPLKALRSSVAFVVEFPIGLDLQREVSPKDLYI